jgi:hypothetical protein
LIRIKEQSKNKYESIIDSKSKEIKNLQQLIHEKEVAHEKSGTNHQVDIMSIYYINYLTLQKKKKI